MSQVQAKAQAKLAGSTPPVPQSTAAQQSDNVAHALAGAGGGLLSMALTYPLITLSTRAQVESKRAQLSTLDAARRIIKREGMTGLYAGMESCAVWHQCHQLRVLLLYGCLIPLMCLYTRANTSKGTNGLAPPSKRLRSELAALPNCPRSSP